MEKTFVSRGSQIQKLRRCENSVLFNKRLKVVLIQGDVGAGKTELVEYFIENIADKKQFLVGQGKCSMETEGEGLLPFAQILTSLTNGGIQWKAIQGNLGEFLTNVAPAWLDILTMGFASAISTTITEGVKLVGAKPTKLSQENIFVQYSNAMREIVLKRPAIIVLEDLHWADRSSLNLLFYLTNNLSALPLFVIATFRPVEAMETGTNAALFREIRANLFRLGAEEIELREGISVDAFVRARYGSSVLPDSLTERIQRKTGGHALFVSELFKLWENRGILRNAQIQHAKVSIERLDEDIELPDDLEAVLAERIKLLSATLQDALRIASVEGEDFTAQTIINLLKADEIKIFDDLVSLERNYRLVEERGAENISYTVVDFYRFTHRFIRDYVYNQLSDGQRRVLHLKVGECMEAIYVNTAPVASQLARHFLEANRLDKAANYMLIAAQTEQNRFSWSEAEYWCQTCISTLDKLPYADFLSLRLHAFDLSGRGFYNTSEFAQASERFLEAINIAEDSHNVSDGVVELFIWLSDTYENVGMYTESAKIVEKGQILLKIRKQQFGAVDVGLISMEGLLKVRAGQENAAIELVNNAIAEAANLEQTPLLLTMLSFACNVEGIAYSFLRRYSKSIPMYKKASDLAEQTGDKNFQITCLINLADDHIQLGNYTDARAMLDRVLALAKQFGDQDNEAYAYYELGFLNLKIGIYDVAEKNLKTSVLIWERLNVSNYLTYALADLAKTYLAQLRPEAALECSQRAVEIASSLREKIYAQIVMAEAQKLSGNPESADKHFKEVILTLTNGQEYPKLQADARKKFAYLLLEQGETQQAKDQFSLALSLYEDLEGEKESDVYVEIAEIQKSLSRIA